MTKFPTDKQSCLCCGQLVYQGGKQRSIPDLEHEFHFLEALGYTRDELLNEHRAQVEYQLPGMIEWLTAN
jgi:hypothetical protein